MLIILFISIGCLMILETAVGFYLLRLYPDNKEAGSEYPGLSQREVVLGVALLGGFSIGGLVGFLLRPSAPVVGQLPLVTVLSRGSDLTGIAELYKEAAVQSFNYMLAGGIVGVVVLGLWAYSVTKKS